MATSKSQEAYGKWYKANKEAHNLSRAVKYKTDESARALAIEKQRVYRVNNPRKASEGGSTRLIGGVATQVFRVKKVSEMIGREQQTLRIWEAKGLIPKPSIPGLHRFYSLHQVGLLREIAALMNEVRYDQQVRSTALAKKSKEIFENWTRG